MCRPLPGSGPPVEHPIRGQSALPSCPGWRPGHAAGSVATSQPLTSGEPGRPLKEAGPGSSSPLGRGARQGVPGGSCREECRTAPDSHPFGCTLLTVAGSPWLCWTDAVHRIPVQTLEWRRPAIRAAWAICCAHRIALRPAHPYGLGDAWTGALARRARRLRAAQRRVDSPETTVSPGVWDANGQTDGSRPLVPARPSWGTPGVRGGGRR